MNQMFRAATDGVPAAALMPLTHMVHDTAEKRGRRHKLRGAKGGKWPLRAKIETPLSQDKLGNARISKYARTVAGNPAGFWRIVEEGSGRHLIAGRRRRGSGTRMTAKGALSRWLSMAARGDDTGFGKLANPIHMPSPYGWKQWADHPGHRSLGRPWRRAMDEAGRKRDPILKSVANKEFTKAFWR
jgi:hypothetical protein